MKSPSFPGTKLVANAKPDGYVLLATLTPAFPVGPVKAALRLLLQPGELGPYAR
jgi:hypothetical protein